MKLRVKHLKQNKVEITFLTEDINIPFEDDKVKIYLQDNIEIGDKEIVVERPTIDCKNNLFTIKKYDYKNLHVCIKRLNFEVQTGMYELDEDFSTSDRLIFYKDLVFL